MHHYRNARQRYEQLGKGNTSDDCPYPTCSAEPLTQPFVFSDATSCIIRPSVPYDVFEGRTVLDHVIAIPRRHLESLSDFTPEEMLGMMGIIATYEQQGYNAYMRGVGGVRSVRHQHTHLIKIRNEKTKFLLYLRNPYIVFKM